MKYLGQLELFEYYHHRQIQENWIDFFRRRRKADCQEMKHEGKSGGKEDVKFKQTRLKAILLSKSDCLSKNAIHMIKVEYLL